MKIICIGRNYSDHIEELANTRPSHPVVFLKPDSSIITKNQNFIIPAFSDEIHHEVELVVKINKVGKHIDESFSNKYYNEIGLGIDFTARDIQNTLKQKGHPWEKSKAFDNSSMSLGLYKIPSIPSFNISGIPPILGAMTGQPTLRASPITKGAFMDPGENTMLLTSCFLSKSITT